MYPLRERDESYERQPPRRGMSSAKILIKAPTIELPPLPEHLARLKLNKDSFKFGTIGLYGLKREKAFYRVVATVGGVTFKIN